MSSINIFYWAILVGFFIIFCGLQMLLAKSPKLYISFLLPFVSLLGIGFFYSRSLLAHNSKPNMGNGMGMLAGLMLFISSLIIFIYAKVKSYFERKNDWE